MKTGNIAAAVPEKTTIFKELIVKNRYLLNLT